MYDVAGVNYCALCAIICANSTLNAIDNQLIRKQFLIRKKMGPLAIGAIGAGVNLAGSLFGQSQAAKAQQAYEKYLGELKDKYTQEKNTAVGQDFLDSAYAKGAVERLNKTLRNRAEVADTNISRTGGTAEQSVAQKTADAGAIGDSISNLAGIGTQYKLQQKQYYDGMINKYENEIAGIKAQEAGKWGQFGQNVSDAAGGLMKSWAYGGFGKGTENPIANGATGLITGKPTTTAVGGFGPGKGWGGVPGLDNNPLLK